MSGDFTRSATPAPIVASAAAISPTQVVVVFHDPSTGLPAELGPSAEDAAQYRLTDSTAVFSRTGERLVDPSNNRTALPR